MFRAACLILARLFYILFSIFFFFLSFSGEKMGTEQVMMTNVMDSLLA